MLSPFHHENFTHLLLELMRCPGSSMNEGPRRQLILDYLGELAVPARTDAAGNVLVDIGDTDSSETVILDAHIDVVEAGCCENPALTDERITGLGSGDNLAAVTMLLMLLAQLDDQCLSRPLQVVFSVGEEGRGNLAGMRQLVADRESPPHCFIAFDSSLVHYTNDAVGCIRYDLEIACEGGHSWNAFGAPNALELLVDFCTELKRVHGEIAGQSRNRVSYNLGTVSGGSGVTSIARTARATFEFRSTSPDLLDRLERHVCALAQEVDAESDRHVSLTEIGRRPAAQPVEGERLAELVTSVWTEAGQSIVSVPRSTNINMGLAAGWPSICIGLCRTSHIHTPQEYVERDSLPLGWQLLGMLVEELLGEKKQTGHGHK